jgi:putative peptidoglycan lipid II flippase
MGFARECVMAFCLGAGIYSDAILIALRISNTFRRIFAEGAFNASFLPRFSGILSKEGKEEANVVLGDVFSALLLILIPFSIIIITIFPSFLQLLISGFDEHSEKFQLTVVLGRICFPYLIFISIASLFCGALNTINKFTLPAVVYSILSVFTIIGLLVSYFLDLSHRLTAHVVIYFVIFSGVVQFYILFASISRHGFRIRFRFSCWTRRVKDIMKNMIPGIIGAGVWQLNLLVDTTISSYLPAGTITCLNLADRLNQFPLGTLGIALSTALLPLLSHAVARQEYAAATQAFERGLTLALFVTLPATAALIALAEPTVSVAYQRGLFTGEQVLITADAVVGFAIGLPAYVLTKIFSTLYFATGDTKYPVISGMFSVLLNALFLLALAPFGKYFCIALSTSLAAISHAIMLILPAKKFLLKQTKTLRYKIFSQVAAASATYFFLQKMASAFWSQDIGTKAVKWLMYMAFLCGAALVFFSTVIVFLCITKQQWRIWRKDIW